MLMLLVCVMVIYIYVYIYIYTHQEHKLFKQTFRAISREKVWLPGF